VLAFWRETPMEIPFQGQFDESMLRRTTLLALRPERGRSSWYLFMAGICLWGWVIFPLINGEPVEPAIYLTLILVVCLFVYAIFFWAPKKQMQAKVLQGLREGTADEVGVHLKTAYTTADLPWDVFTRWKLGKGLVLLYDSTIRNQVQVFPREFFASETDWIVFVELVRQRMPAAAKKSLPRRPWLIFLISIVIFILFLFVYNVVRDPGH
jgi:hypothetical protein